MILLFSQCCKSFHLFTPIWCTISTLGKFSHDFLSYSIYRPIPTYFTANSSKVFSILFPLSLETTSAQILFHQHEETIFSNQLRATKSNSFFPNLFLKSVLILLEFSPLFKQISIPFSSKCFLQLAFRTSYIWVLNIIQDHLCFFKTDIICM